ncbi:MAG: c-type cytochrome [Pseudomonadota bacterium]|nr:cytochrome c4 [Pseudomonadales bacterium]MDY6921455.1 c-type cytochrome [Pseudomonadota bacterium]
MKLVSNVLVAAILATGAVNWAQAAGDPQAGKEKSATCAACHGPNGNSTIPNFPKLAGQVEKYTLKQLQDMKSGARQVPQMTAIVAGLSDQDMADLAAYYAEQEVTTGTADPELAEKGAKLWRAGNAEAGVTACAGCHGAAGKGMPEAAFPALAGQHAAYTQAQLEAFRAAGRGDHEGPYRNNDGDAMMMRSTAARLTDDDIQALASFINGLYD